MEAGKLDLGSTMSFHQSAKVYTSSARLNLLFNNGLRLTQGE